MDYLQIIKDLVALGERQLTGETKAQAYIVNFLEEHSIAFQIDTYTTYIPRYQSWGLRVDGETIESLPCGLISGKITSADNILSSLISSQKNLYDANINFNPRCDEISRSNHYYAPALAIARKDVGRVVNAATIDGFVEVEKTEHTSANILVGNTENPKRIIVSHYDSIGPGAVDNATGIALSLMLITSLPESLKDNLYILCGNEELSYDEGIYWGHGYREFETKRGDLLAEAVEVIILDSFGYAKTEEITDVAILKLAFPISDIEKYKDKLVLLSGDFAQLMEFYHARNDIGKQIVKQYFIEAYENVRQRLSK